MKSKEIRVAFRINESEWKLFKLLSKKNESDASKEIRKFIKQYISNNIKDGLLLTEEVEDIYKLYLDNSNNFKFYLVKKYDDGTYSKYKILGISKYFDFEQINRLYLINRKNIKNVLDGFIKKFEDKNFIEEYNLDIDEDEINEIIKGIKSIDVDNIDYDKVFNLIESIDEKCYQVVNDVLDEKAEKILNDMLKNSDSFHCLYFYEDLKRLIKKEKKKEILVIVPDDILTKLSDVDIDYEDNIVYYILSQSQDSKYQFENFYYLSDLLEKREDLVVKITMLK